jgi:hypothetical protein
MVIALRNLLKRMPVQKGYVNFVAGSGEIIS